MAGQTFVKPEVGWGSGGGNKGRYVYHLHAQVMFACLKLTSSLTQWSVCELLFLVGTSHQISLTEVLKNVPPVP